MTYATKLLSKKEARLTGGTGKDLFYGKAKTIDENGKVTLQSYWTDVAEYDKDTGKVTVKGWWSPTTQRHVNAFLSNYGKKTLSKKEMSGGITL